MSEDLVIQGPASIESYAHNLQDKLSFASVLIKSGMLPAAFKTPEAVLTAILYGKELGFSPIRALNTINVIQGKPTISAEGLKALAIQHGGKFKAIEWTAERCTIECARGTWIESFTFTIDDAKKQGLLGKDNWQRMPKQMLYARCVSTLIRNMFADVIAGLYSSEEMQDSQPEGTVKVLTYEKKIEIPEPKLSPKSEADKPDWMDAPSPIEILEETLANCSMNFQGKAYRYDLPHPEDLEEKQINFMRKNDFVYDAESDAWYSDNFIEKMKDKIKGPKK